jgi:hypothetical protein
MPSEQEMQRIAELEVRRYFDTYLRDVWPEQATKMREHTHLMIEKHDADDDAHDRVVEKVGGVEKRIDRAKWIAVGALAVGGGIGAVGKAVLSAILGG